MPTSSAAAPSPQAAPGGRPIVLPVVAAALAAGGVLALLGHASAARQLFVVATLAGSLAALVEALRALRAGRAGTDWIALLAMAGALATGEALAGALVALMLTGGTALERLALSRARKDLEALLARAPRLAHRRTAVGVEDVPVDAIRIGDRLVVKPGEVVPADGVVTGAPAVVDESALTGESRPVTLAAGEAVRSGGASVGASLELRVTAPPAESTYAGIVRLVRAAEQAKAPFVRLADRHARSFLGLSLGLAALAGALSGDPRRALAVLVVATPCPLLLAVPAAILAGVSRAARHGVIVKGGGPLETLARASHWLFDKTGTVTAARPQVVALEPLDTVAPDELLRLAASLEQASTHPYAPAILAAAQARGLALAFPSSAEERTGTGIVGRLEGDAVAVGRLGFVAPSAPRTAALRALELRCAIEGSSAVFVARAGRLLGALLLQDPLRPEAPRLLRALREAGASRLHLVTGDHPDVAELVGDALGVDRVFAERSPEEKVDVVRRVRAEGVTAMVGDGINDAPALALADVGIAMGARGATAASEAADVVLTADRLEGLVLVTRIARRTRRIARQSALAGMGLSLVAMGFAAAGRLPPVAGALLQEAIDLLVLGNALRALGGPGLPSRRLPGARQVAAGLGSAHRTLRPAVAALSTLAAKLPSLSPAEAQAELLAARRTLETELLPHEASEQRTAYPLLARVLPDQDPTGPLIGTHHEIRRRVRLFGRYVDRLAEQGPGPDELRDLQRALFGLHAILTLHFAQEEELYALLEA